MFRSIRILTRAENLNALKATLEKALSTTSLRPISISNPGHKAMGAWDRSPKTSQGHKREKNSSQDSTISAQSEEGVLASLESWDSKKMGKKPDEGSKVDFDRLLSNDVYLAEKMLEFLQFGILVIENAPVGDDVKLNTFWEKLDSMCRSYYGATFKVREVSHPLHLSEAEMQDLSELTKSGFPQIEVVQCEEGESVSVEVCDGVRVGEALREEDPSVFTILSTTAFGHPHHTLSDVVQHSPVICLNSCEEITSVVFDPQCRSWFYKAPSEEVPKAYRALKTFYDSCYNPKHLLSIQLAPGQMLMCSKKRVLCHLKKEFSVDSGLRLFEAGYITYASVKDRLEAIIMEHYAEAPVLR